MGDGRVRQMKRGKLIRPCLCVGFVISLVTACSPKSVKELIKDWQGQVKPPPGSAQVVEYFPTTFSVPLTPIGEPKPMSNVAGTYITDDYGKLTIEYQLSGQSGDPIRIYAVKFGSDTLGKGFWNKFRDNIQADPDKQKYRSYTTKNAYLYYEHGTKNYAMVARLIGIAFYAIQVPRNYPDYESTALKLDADLLAHFRALQQKLESSGESGG